MNPECCQPGGMALFGRGGRRLAFTLTELLIVIAALGILAALLSPAVQSARESSRAAACRNNLKQVGIALLNYESMRRHFPKGAEGRYDRVLSPTYMVGLSWWAEALPYMEQGNVADRLDRIGPNPGWVYLNAHNGELANGFAPTFWFCPSSSVERFVKSGGFQIAAPSYAGISGATSHDDFPETRVSRCCRSDGEISAGGVLVPNTVISARQITDGFAKTLLLGEQSDFAFTQTGQPRPIGAAFVLGWIAGSKAIGVPPEYGDWQSPSYNLTTVRYGLNEHRYDLPGIYIDVGANNPLLSAHPTVVNLLYCDGSVHAVNDSLEVALLKSLATRDNSTGIAP